MYYYVLLRTKIYYAVLSYVHLCYRNTLLTDHWSALSRLIDLMRRAGQLEGVVEFLKKAETQNNNAQMIAGYNYCKGLHLWLDISKHPSLILVPSCITYFVL